MAGILEVVLEDVSETRAIQLEEAIISLLQNSISSTLIILPNPALEAVVIAGVIHGLRDLWEALAEEGLTLSDDEMFPTLLKVLLSQPSFQKKLSEAAVESLTPAR